MSFCDDKNDNKSPKNLNLFHVGESSSSDSPMFSSPERNPRRERKLKLELEKQEREKKKEEFQSRFIQAIEGRQLAAQFKPTVGEAFLSFLGTEMKELSEGRQRSLRMRILTMVAEEIEKYANENK